MDIENNVYGFRIHAPERENWACKKLYELVRAVK